MSYELLTDEEFTHELEVLKTMTERLRSQAEKLVALKAEGRVSDQVYNEVLNEISQRYDVLSDKMSELNKANEAKKMKLKEELKNLRYQLESLEVRYAVGSVPEDQYKLMRANLLFRIQEIEDLLNRVNTLFMGAMENANKSESILGKRVRKLTPAAQPATPTPTQKAEPIPSQAQVATTAQTQPPTPEKPVKKGVKNCQRCGAENPDNAIYCFNCGAKL
ncbi:MAG: zinc ribbon domain-containing protein [Thermoproteota archaeon]